MQESLNRLLGFANDIWRYRWIAMAAVWLLAVAGWLTVSILPNKYEATARVYIDTDSILRPLLKGIAVETADASDRLGLMTQKLLSRPNIEKIARMVDLDIYASTEAEKEDLLEQLRQDITLRAISTKEKTQRNAPPDLYEISATHKDPKVAKAIVQSLLTVFVESSLGETRQDAEVAQSFLDQQIKEYEARLTEAENQLQEFKRKHIDVQPEEGRSYFQRLQAAKEDLDQAELEMRQAQYRRDELQRQLDELKTSGTSVAAEGKTYRSPIEDRIVALQSKLDELLLKYTDRHPDVIQLKESIAALKRQLEGEGQAAASADDAALALNPVYQQTRVALGEADAALASAQVRKAEYARRVAKLQAQVETLPKVEAELQRLNRDYEINKENYAALVARRESAKMAEQVKDTGQQVKFQVIDPPRVPLEPAAPNRPLLSSGVLLGGLGGGLGLALLLAQLRPVFYGTRALSEKITLPVLGSVSLVPKAGAQARQRIEVTVLAVSGVVLLVVYGGVVFLQLSGRPVLEALQDLKGLI